MVYNYVRKETKRLAKKHFGCNVEVKLFEFENISKDGEYITVGYCNKPSLTIGYLRRFLIENSDNMRVINALIVHEVGHLAYPDHDDLHDAFCITRGYNPDPDKEMLMR